MTIGTDIANLLGTYVLRDDLLLATPPPHVSEGPSPPNPNPLATTPVPPTSGTLLSIVSGSSSAATRSLYQIRSSASGSSHVAQNHDLHESPNESQISSEGEKNEGGSEASSPALDGAASKSSSSVQYTPNIQSAPAFGEGNASLSASSSSTGKDVVKRRKPKNSVSKSNSTFISRTVEPNDLKKRISSLTSEDVLGFANIGRAFYWLDLSEPKKVSLKTPTIDPHGLGPLFFVIMSFRLHQFRLSH
jgi:catabolite repression protein CreC